MNDVQLMQVGHSADNIFKKPAGLDFIKFGLFDNVVEQFSLFDILHHQEQMFGSFDNLYEWAGTS